MTTRLLAVSVGQPRVIGARSAEPVRSGIGKSPVDGRVVVGRNGIVGDSQADMINHGGVDKAVYAFDRGDAVFWEQRLGRPLPAGSFGENLTVEGLPSDIVRVGDRYRIGDVLFEVTQPRVPCYKLGIHMKDPAFPAAFAKALRVGFYLRVIEPGSLGAGDSITTMHRAETVLSIADLMQIYLTGQNDIERLAEAVALPGLSSAWQEELAERLAKVKTIST